MGWQDGAVVLGLNLMAARGLSVKSLHVLPVPAWVSSCLSA